MKLSGALLLQAALLLLHGARKRVAAIRCYCTEQRCESLGYCQASWCVVGIRRDDHQVIRTCGSANAAQLTLCHRGLAGWVELCACQADYCNSFAFLRQQVRAGRLVDAAGDDDGDEPRFISVDGGASGAGDDDSVVFGRLDDSTDVRVFGADEYAASRRSGGRTRARKKGVARPSQLIVLLVLVPLVIGAAAVLVVAANYYCRLC